MDCYVSRLYSDGGKLPATERRSLRVRGTFSIDSEHVDGQHVLVARLRDLPRGTRSVPALFEPTLKPTFAGVWVIAGHERTRPGSIVEERRVHQVWLVADATPEKLAAAEAKLGEAGEEIAGLHSRIHDLWAEIAALQPAEVKKK